MTAVSNSRTQKEFIDSRCKERGLTNLTVVTADVVKYQTKETFDRVVSVEMFEHMKNYQVPLSGYICTSREHHQWGTWLGVISYRLGCRGQAARHFQIQKGEQRYFCHRKKLSWWTM